MIAHTHAAAIQPSGSHDSSPWIGHGPGLRSTPYLDKASRLEEWSALLGVGVAPLGYGCTSKTDTGTTRYVFSGLCRIIKRRLISKSTESTKGEIVGSVLK